MYRRKKRLNKPWVENSIVLNNKTLKSKIVQVLCRSSNTGYGAVVKVVTDGELKIVAAFSDDSVKSALDDLDGEDSPSWNTALLILHEFSIELRNIPGKDYGEFILFVERFNIWNLQPGYQAKYDFKYCMENEKIWDRMMEVYAERKHRKCNPAADTSNTGSVSLTQLLDEMAAPSGGHQSADDEPEHGVALISDSLRKKLLAPFTASEFRISNEDMASLDQIDEWKPDYIPQSSLEDKQLSDDMIHASYCHTQTSLLHEDEQVQDTQSSTSQANNNMTTYLGIAVGQSQNTDDVSHQRVESMNEASPKDLSHHKLSDSVSQEASQWQEGLDSVRFSFETEESMSSPEHVSPVISTSQIGLPAAHSTQRECIPSISTQLEQSCDSQVLVVTKGSSMDSLESSNSVINDQYTEMKDDNRVISSQDNVSQLSLADSDKQAMIDYYLLDTPCGTLNTEEIEFTSREYSHTKKRKKLMKLRDTLEKKLTEALVKTSPSKQDQNVLSVSKDSKIDKTHNQPCDIEIRNKSHAKEAAAAKDVHTAKVDVSNAMTENISKGRAKDRVEINEDYTSLQDNESGASAKSRSSKNVLNRMQTSCKVVDCVNESNNSNEPSEVQTAQKTDLPKSNHFCGNLDNIKNIKSSDSSGHSEVSKSPGLGQGTDNAGEQNENNATESSETLYPSSTFSTRVTQSDNSTPDTCTKEPIQDAALVTNIGEETIKHAEPVEIEQLIVGELDGKTNHEHGSEMPANNSEKVVGKKQEKVVARTSSAIEVKTSSKKQKKGESETEHAKENIEIAFNNLRYESIEENPERVNSETQIAVAEISTPTLDSGKNVCSETTASKVQNRNQHQHALLSPSQFGNGPSSERKCSEQATKFNSLNNDSQESTESSPKLLSEPDVLYSRRRSLRLRNKDCNSVTKHNEVTANAEDFVVDAKKDVELERNSERMLKQSCILNIAPTTAEMVDQKLNSMARKQAKLSITNTRKNVCKSGDLVDIENQVSELSTDIMLESGQNDAPNGEQHVMETKMDNKKQTEEVAVECAIDSTSTITACNERGSHSIKNGNNSPGKILQHLSDNQGGNKDEKKEGNMSSKNLDKESYKETFSEESGTQSHIAATQPFDVALFQGTQGFTPNLDNSMVVSDSSVNELFEIDKGNDIHVKKTDHKLSSNNKFDAIEIEIVRENDTQGTEKSFTKILKKPMPDKTDKLAKKDNRKVDLSESLTSSESVVFMEPLHKHSTKHSVKLNLDSHPTNLVDIPSRKKRTLSLKSMLGNNVFSVKPVQKKRKRTLGASEAEEISKKIKYTVSDVIDKCTEPDIDSDSVLVKGKANNVDVEDEHLSVKHKANLKTYEPKKVFIDGHCFGNKIMWPNYIENKVTKPSGEMKQKHCRDESNRKRLSYHSSQSSGSNEQNRNESNHQDNKNVTKKNKTTPNKKGQLKYGKVNGEFRFYREGDHNLEIPNLKTPERKSGKQDTKYAKTGCSECKPDSPVLMCKKLTPRKLCAGTHELDKNSFVEDWLMKHKSIGESIQPEGSQEWALSEHATASNPVQSNEKSDKLRNRTYKTTGNQSDNTAGNQPDNTTENRLNRSDEDLFDYSDSSDNYKSQKYPLNQNKSNRKHKIDTGLRQTTRREDTACDGKIDQADPKSQQKIHEQQKPLSAADMYFKMFEML